MATKICKAIRTESIITTTEKDGSHKNVPVTSFAPELGFTVEAPISIAADDAGELWYWHT